MLDIKTIRSSRPKNLLDASEREAVLLAAIDLLGTQPAAARPSLTAPAARTAPAVVKAGGTKAFLAEIDNAAKAGFIVEGAARVALDKILASAAALTPQETQAQGVHSLLIFVNRVSTPAQTGRTVSAVNAIAMIASARRGMIVAK